MGKSLYDFQYWMYWKDKLDWKRQKIVYFHSNIHQGNCSLFNTPKIGMVFTAQRVTIFPYCILFYDKTTWMFWTWRLPLPKYIITESTMVTDIKNNFSIFYNYVRKQYKYLSDISIWHCHLTSSDLYVLFQLILYI